MKLKMLCVAVGELRTGTKGGKEWAMRAVTLLDVAKGEERCKTVVEMTLAKEDMGNSASLEGVVCDVTVNEIAWDGFGKCITLRGRIAPAGVPRVGESSGGESAGGESAKRESGPQAVKAGESGAPVAGKR
jgi:hypothetical protein